MWAHYLSNCKVWNLLSAPSSQKERVSFPGVSYNAYVQYSTLKMKSCLMKARDLKRIITKGKSTEGFTGWGGGIKFSIFLTIFCRVHLQKFSLPWIYSKTSTRRKTDIEAKRIVYTVENKRRGGWKVKQKKVTSTTRRQSSAVFPVNSFVCMQVITIELS